MRFSQSKGTDLQYIKICDLEHPEDPKPGKQSACGVHSPAGYCQICRCSGAFQYRNHANLSAFLRSGASGCIGPVAAHMLKKTESFFCLHEKKQIRFSAIVSSENRTLKPCFKAKSVRHKSRTALPGFCDACHMLQVVF